MGSIWCFNRGNFKQNADRTGQEQSTWILSGRASILKSILHPFSTITFPVAPFTFFSSSVAAVRWLIHLKGPLAIYSVAPEVTYEKYAQCHSSLCFAYDQVTAFTSPCPWAAFRGHDTSSSAFCTMGQDTLATILEGRAVLSQSNYPSFSGQQWGCPIFKKKKNQLVPVWKTQLLDAVKYPLACVSIKFR